MKKRRQCRRRRRRSRRETRRMKFAPTTCYVPATTTVGRRQLRSSASIRNRKSSLAVDRKLVVKRISVTKFNRKSIAVDGSQMFSAVVHRKPALAARTNLRRVPVQITGTTFRVVLPNSRKWSLCVNRTEARRTSMEEIFCNGKTSSRPSN